MFHELALRDREDELAIPRNAGSQVTIHGLSGLGFDTVKVPHISGFVKLSGEWKLNLWRPERYLHGITCLIAIWGGRIFVRLGS
jgi:hypothetical protein